MKTVGSREFKNRMGQYMRAVRRGQTLLVTDRGKAIAKVSPVSEADRSDNDLSEILKRLESEGKIRLGTRPMKPFRGVPGRGKLASEMIIEDRH
jgi:prevent-host-death family protein